MTPEIMPITICNCGQTFRKIPMDAEYVQSKASWQWTCKCGALVSEELVDVWPKQNKNLRSLIEGLEAIDALIEKMRPETEGK